MMNSEIPGECVTEETLTDYLDGALDPIVKAASEVHLIACDQCRSRLVFFMKLLKEELDPREQVALVAIQDNWKKGQVQHYVPARRTGVYHRWMLALGGIVAVLVLAVGVSEIVGRIGEPRSASEVVQLLLDQHNRPFEGRLSGQPALPFLATRGPEDSETTNFGLLVGQMTRLSATSSEMGQFYLLQRKFDRAIDYLQPVARESGATPEIHNDLGVAYLESGVPQNLQKALNEFRLALVVKSDFAPASFNLAIVYERMHDTVQERQELLHLLKIETDPAWADQARAKFEGIRN
jgi:tetratricopeptide (TPR) repeat protein